MAVSTNSDFVDFIVPLRERMKYYDKIKPPTDQPQNDAADPARALPQGFIDAMIVRESVYVNEQGIPLENELDEDDKLSFHWVAYASMPAKAAPSASSPNANGQFNEAKRKSSTSTKIPVGTLRMVPPPHTHPHPNGQWHTAVQQNNESYVKLGRLAVIKEFRGAGIAKLLVDTALTFIRNYQYELHENPQLEYRDWKINSLDYTGLVLVHSQKAVQKVWRRYGFETDDSMGTWDEEGIEHVGMWKRVTVRLSNVDDIVQKSLSSLPEYPS